MDAYPKTHLKTALLMAITLLVLAVALPARETPKVADSPVSLAVNVAPVSAPAPEPAKPSNETTTVATEQPVEAPLAWHNFPIKRGDTLSSLFRRAGLTPSDLHEVMHSGKIVSTLKRIRPGESVDLALDNDGKFQELRYRATPLKYLLVTRVGDSYHADWQTIVPQTLISYGTGKITPEDPSMYTAGRKAGLPDDIIMELANIFQWDVSFALDLRQGDSFTVMYEQNYVDGKRIGNGDIVAAEFNNMGKHYEAVLYKDSHGHKDYFTPDGLSMRKAFLRDPVHFRYISSGFNPHRMHPIFHRIMPHWGVDFVAPIGTPVRATGDGRVTIARRNAASGRYIVIRSGSEYTTKYLHLHRFARGIRAGASVKQGQVIGYVGQSGWATGPHLHYEFLVNGVHRNPRTVPLPKAAPIAKTELARFQQQIRPLLAQLDAVSGKTGYAMATQTTAGQ